MDSRQHMDRAHWDALIEEGFVPGVELHVEAMFFSTDQEAAEELAVDLCGRGWHAETWSEVTGRLFWKKTVWGVVAQREVCFASVDDIHRMTADLDQTSDGHRSVFDGWGAELGPLDADADASEAAPR